MANERVHNITLLRYSLGKIEQAEDLIAVEEPMEIRLGYGSMEKREQNSLSITMRTPGNDFELTLGFLYTEGIISSAEEVEHIHYCKSDKAEEQQNIVRVELRPTLKPDWKKLQRHFYTSSSCGVCGKTSIEAVEVECGYISEEFLIAPEVIHLLPDKLQGHQPVFTYTGGLHAAGLFSLNGEPLIVREDVGRHNAVDKVIGTLIQKKETTGKVMVVSGRASFELVQKAARAKIPVLVAVGAPSSLSVKLAEAKGMTLIGFTRGNRFNIYCGKNRIEINKAL